MSAWIITVWLNDAGLKAGACDWWFIINPVTLIMLYSVTSTYFLNV